MFVLPRKSTNRQTGMAEQAITSPQAYKGYTSD